ncbi:NAD(P)-dependent dehydrogenase (short-subunit alcohol dehydrogenase family) [Microbacterium resistens]|uniref:NAD(P)-dependent dehydrogenase (Short-subunit alcohol dehydrogenase family) n=1 Tax=Microbacterium resistens TaxID=156977 RepID=A0ABU1SAD3_9MICO|nr:SDR family oxidoreductase [Microbacterium resistens]MDR6865792.1 NAD(P)-dependent dehydrogenase (short-subunit alcohol dehydrogenase family) [Microbacterium resistens]
MRASSPLALQDRTVVLIGGSTGIGYETAALAIAQGARVVLGGRTPARLESAVSRLGGNAAARVVDTSEEESIAAFFAGVGTVDAVFTTAADYATGPFATQTVSEARSPFESKFWGQYRVVHAALPHLSPDASVVLMSGAASVRPPGPAAAYVAANAAIEGLARGLAVELAPIRVNAVAPGTIDGHLWRSRPAEVRDAAFSAYSADALLARPGTEREIAAAVMHLFTSTYTTGSTLYVDGGYALR